MVMKPEPWAEALEHGRRARGPVGRGGGAAPRRPRARAACRSRQALARSLADEPWLAFACGRYEGIDERVYEHAARPDAGRRSVSLGDYVLNGGEVAVLAMVEAVGRLLPGRRRQRRVARRGVARGRPARVPRLHAAGLLGRRGHGARRARRCCSPATTARSPRGGTRSGSSARPPAAPTCCRSRAHRGGAGRPRRAGRDARRCRRAARAAAGLLGAGGRRQRHARGPAAAREPRRRPGAASTRRHAVGRPSRRPPRRLGARATAAPGDELGGRAPLRGPRPPGSRSRPALLDARRVARAGDGIRTSRCTTGRSQHGNQRFYKKAGYRPRSSAGRDRSPARSTARSKRRRR